jgi:hypothetical protein
LDLSLASHSVDGGKQDEGKRDRFKDAAVGKSVDQRHNDE